MDLVVDHVVWATGYRLARMYDMGHQVGGRWRRCLLIVAKQRSARAVDSGRLLRDKRLTLAGCELVLSVTSRRTLQRDLRGLVEGGLIREVGQATDPTRHYLWQEL